MTPSLETLQRHIAAYRRHTRATLDLPLVNRWGLRRHAGSLVDYLGSNPDLLDPCAHPGRLEQVVEYALQAGDDDIRYHATEAAGTWLRDHFETPLLADMVVRIIGEYAVTGDLRSPAMLLGHASQRRGSWVRTRLEDSPLSEMRLAVVAMHRRGGVRPDDLQAGDMGTREERIRFLERAGKISFGAAFRDPARVSLALSLLEAPPPESLRSGGTWQDRALAADLLAAGGPDDPALVPELLEHMQRDPEAEVRVRAKVAFVARTTAPEVPIQRTRDAAAHLVDLIESVGEGEDGRLRYANGALVPIMQRLSLALRGDSTAFEALHERLDGIAAGHPVAYNRKTAVKLCAKLLKGQRSRKPEWVHRGIQRVLSALDDPDPVVREEAFLSVIKRGWTPLLTDRELDAVADRLPAIDGEDDQGLLQTLACFLPRLAAAPPWLPDEGPPDAVLERVAVHGGEAASRLVSGIRCELPDWRRWTARVGLASLLEMGRAAGDEAPHLYHDALPALAEGLGDDLDACWPGLRDVARSAGARCPGVLGVLVPRLHADLGALFAPLWGGVVRLAGGFDWAHKSQDWFRTGILGAHGLLSPADAGTGLWPGLLALGLQSDKHWVKTFDNLRHLRDLAYPGETPALLDTLRALVADREDPHPVLKRINLLIWVLRESVGGAAAFEGVRRELERVASYGPAYDRVTELGRIPSRLSGGRGPQLIYLG